MSSFTVMKLVSATLAVAGSASAQVGAVLAPVNDIVFPSSGSALDPLHYSGANCPWFAGPDVFDIPYEVPEGCTVQQAAYTVRHGSRFPDSGSYGAWVILQEKIQAALVGEGFTASGPLAFIPGWQTALSNPTLQMSQQSMTGFKEAHDLGYELRGRYPTFYEDGNDYMVWANQYAAPINESRVVQTAKAFLQGYLHVFAPTYGTVVAVNSTGAADALGDSLAPADLCPAYTNIDGSNITDFDNVWVPDALARVNAMITGNLTFTESDLLYFPYLCGYESQILGSLSPWCGVLNDTELEYYQYSQDIAYYYGVGPGSDGAAKKVFLPYMDELLSLFMEGPGQQGVGLDGTTYSVPNLIMSFLNDDQLSELASILGIFDGEAPLPIDHFPGAHIFDVSHFITMRGTIAFEVLNCLPSAPQASSSATFVGSTISGSATGTSGASSTGVVGRSSTGVAGSSSTATGTPGLGSNSTTTAPGSLSTGAPTSSSVGVVTVVKTVTASDCAATTTAPPARKFKRSAAAVNETYIRIIFNDAVYPVAACQSGPGNSCLLSEYAAFMHKQNEDAGDFVTFCNVTAAGHETTVVNGASFYTNLTLDYLTFVKP